MEKKRNERGKSQHSVVWFLFFLISHVFKFLSSLFSRRSADRMERKQIKKKREKKTESKKFNDRFEIVLCGVRLWIVVIQYTQNVCIWCGAYRWCFSRAQNSRHCIYHKTILFQVKSIEYGHIFIYIIFSSL